MAATHQPIFYALIFAIAVHLAIIFGVTFTLTTPSAPSTISTTLNHHANNEQPETAQHYAQQQQQGDNANTAIPSVPIASSAAASETRAVLTTTGPSHAISYVPQQYTDHPPDPFAHIQELIEHYTVLLDPNTSTATHMPIAEHYQDDEFEQIAATFAHIEAAYIETFRRTVEQVGTANFPPQALAQNIFGSVRLLVAIQANGHVTKIEVLTSSGHQILDDAALQSVRLAAPFAPFDSALREHVSELQLIRTWRFDREQVLSNY